MMETNAKPVPAGLDAAIAHTAEVYSTCDATEIFTKDYPLPPEVWGGLRLAPGQIMEIIGASGLGKSRILLNLAINQVLGKEFAGMPTYDKPLVWLFYGNENSPYRFSMDLKKMLKDLPAEEFERLRNKIFLPTMEKPSDNLISFAYEDNVERLKATMRQHKPDVLVMDPWGAIINGDELKDGDVRNTIVTIQDILMTNPEKPAVGIVLNHSRNGLMEEVNAAGPNKANFGKNSKAIYSVVRCVWNLRRAELSENPKKIELIHAKSSDMPPYPNVAVEFDPETHRYEKDEDFNPAVWQRTLEKAPHSNTILTIEQRQVVKEDEDQKVCDMMMDFISQNDGAVPRPNFDTWRISKGIGEKRMQNTIKTLHGNGRIDILRDKKNCCYICTPKKAQDLLGNNVSGSALRLVPRSSTPQGVPRTTP